MIVGVIGSGAMGRGIAQVAAMAGHPVHMMDVNASALEGAMESLRKVLDTMQQKGKITDATEIVNRIKPVASLQQLSTCELVIEAVVESLDVKKKIFSELETLVSPNCILATNTSSLSVTSIAAACKEPSRCIGLHFFNPPPLMALVEVVPAVQTNVETLETCMALMNDWGKTPVRTKDEPGFIVNRLARPFYGEALRILEEGIADIPTIDWAMTEHGGFRMGPFTLMDYIGHDVNFVVTKTVFESFFYDPRYKPSFTQQRLLEAGWLGRKTGKGFYDYSRDLPLPTKDESLANKIVERIVCMLINEAMDATYLSLAAAEDLDVAMTKGVNYPKGLMAWAKEMGYQKVLQVLDDLYYFYKEDRYRASPMLRKLASAQIHQ